MLEKTLGPEAPLVPSFITGTTDSRYFRERGIPAYGFSPFVLAGGPNFRSEVSNVYELGFRTQASPYLSFSVTAFHHDHEDLRTLSPAPGGAVIANDLEGRTSGIEAWGSWRGARWWRIDAGIARLDQSLKLRPGAEDLHAHLNTAEVAFNRLGERELCPGAAMLERINASLR